MASINAITKLLVDEEEVDALGPFVERFRHRILEAAADVDVGACSAAFVLLQLLLKHDLLALPQLAPIIRCAIAVVECSDLMHSLLHYMLPASHCWDSIDTFCQWPASELSSIICALCCVLWFGHKFLNCKFS
jgi:cobalamin synthase